MKNLTFRDYLKRRKIDLEKFFGRFKTYAALCKSLRAKGVDAPTYEKVKEWFEPASPAPPPSPPKPVSTSPVPPKDEKKAPAKKKRKPQPPKAAPRKKKDAKKK